MSTIPVTIKQLRREVRKQKTATKRRLRKVEVYAHSLRLQIGRGEAGVKGFKKMAAEVMALYREYEETLLKERVIRVLQKL